MTQPSAPNPTQAAAIPGGLVQQFTFFAGCLARTPFRDQVAAAAKAGFDSISIWPNIWRHAQRKQGLSIHDMRLMLDDHGLKLTEVDACRDWVPASEGGLLGPGANPIPRHEMLEVCQQLGGSGIVAVHVSNAPLNLDRETAGFAQLCDDAAHHGLRVGLEFVAFGGVPDVATACRIVQDAGRPNGGLVVDLWHHVRSSWDDAALDRLPANKVYTVQFSDGPAKAPPDLVDEAMYHRAWPGTGQMDVPGFLRRLDRLGVRASVGAELYHADFEQQDPADVVRQIAESSRAMFRAAGLPGVGAKA